MYLNDGLGSFTYDSSSAIASATDSTNAVAFADVDGDGGARRMCL